MGTATLLCGILSLLAPLLVFIIQTYIVQKKWFGIILFVVYVFILLYETILKRGTDHEYIMNLTPFWSYSHFMESEYRWQIYQNVFLFIPYGFLMPFLTRWPYRYIVTIGILISAFIEMFQYINRIGLCEFDDVFHNALGIIIGCILWKLTNLVDKKYGDLITKKTSMFLCKAKEKIIKRESTK